MHKTNLQENTMTLLMQMDKTYMQEDQHRWVRQHTKDMLNGDVDPEAYEQSYYEAALKMKDFYKDSNGTCR